MDIKYFLCSSFIFSHRNNSKSAFLFKNLRIWYCNFLYFSTISCLLFVEIPLVLYGCTYDDNLEWKYDHGESGSVCGTTNCKIGFNVFTKMNVAKSYILHVIWPTITQSLSYQ